MNKPDLTRRSTCLEIMDTKSFSFEEFNHYLQVLERINFWTIAYRPTLNFFKQALGRMPPQRTISILDVGCGNGDMLRQIGIWAQKHHINVKLAGVDLNPMAKLSAERAMPIGMPIYFETANIFDIHPAQPVDFIICSLFAHHLTAEENIRVLSWMNENAVLGWFINDLHRHSLPYTFIKYAIRFLCSNPYVQHDAPLSVARAFKKNDWLPILKEAGVPITKARIKWFFPFRYCVSCIK